MALNKGKIQVGSAAAPAAVSYGPTSPADDPIPLAWKAGDVRYYSSSNTVGSFGKVGVKWVCITSGTPGVWQLVRIPYNLPIVQTTYTYGGIYNHPGTEVWMAPATADWREGNEDVDRSPVLPIAPSADLESIGPGPTVLSLDIWIAFQEWAVTTADGLLFQVKRDTGVVLLSDTFDASPLAIGSFHVGAAFAAGAFDGVNQGLCASLTSDFAAGAGEIRLQAVLTLWRNFSADFPS